MQSVYLAQTIETFLVLKDAFYILFLLQTEFLEIIACISDKSPL